MALEYFCCFHSYRDKLANLTDEQIGRIFRAALLYSDTGEVIELDPLESLAFNFIRYDIDKTHKEYELKCQKNRANIQKRYNASTSEYDRTPSNTIEYDGYQSKSKSKSKSESESRESITPSADAPSLRKYGEYENVILTDEEYSALLTEFSDDYQERIEKLSEYMASSGKEYKNHLAVIRKWAREDKTKETADSQKYTEEELDELFGFEMPGKNKT